jgi:serine O-acetyltransferase
VVPVLKAFEADILRYRRHCNPLCFGGVRMIITYELGLQALLVYRIGQLCGGRPKASLRKILSQIGQAAYWFFNIFIRAAYGINIDCSALIAPGLYIGHFGGIRVTNCQIAEMCSIHQGVFIGSIKAESLGPNIASRVWIGPHAKIIGAIRVGEGATVAAGALVTEDVPPKCFVAGRPARIVKRNYDNSAFL